MALQCRPHEVVRAAMRSLYIFNMQLISRMHKRMGFRVDEMSKWPQVLHFAVELVVIKCKALHYICVIGLSFAAQQYWR